MAKDPAFLFYPNDWLGGTTGMSFEEKGAYMELLVLQFNKGPFSLLQAKKLLNLSFERLWPELIEKFKEENGKFFNARLEAEKEKRKINAKKNKERIEKYWNDKKNTVGNSNVYTKTVPIENENENENENTNELKNKNSNAKKFLCPEMQKVFKTKVKTYSPNQERDYEPLLSIANFIHEQENMEGNSTQNQPHILAVWDKLSIWISQDIFYSQKSLKTISNHIQEIFNKANHGTNKSSTAHKPGTSEARIAKASEWGL